jgi:hypothetical protein
MGADERIDQHQIRHRLREDRPLRDLGKLGSNRPTSRSDDGQDDTSNKFTAAEAPRPMAKSIKSSGQSKATAPVKPAPAAINGKRKIEVTEANMGMNRSSSGPQDRDYGRDGDTPPARANKQRKPNNPDDRSADTSALTSFRSHHSIDSYRPVYSSGQTLFRSAVPDPASPSTP